MIRMLLLILIGIGLYYLAIITWSKNPTKTLQKNTYIYLIILLVIVASFGMYVYTKSEYTKPTFIEYEDRDVKYYLNKKGAYKEDIPKNNKKNNKTKN